MDFELFKFSMFGKERIITPWEVYGLIGAFMFSARWFVQLYYSKLAGRSVTPRSFWIMSMIGSMITLSYFMKNVDTVGIAGNMFPSFIAAYNLYLEYRHDGKEQPATREKPAAPARTPQPQVSNAPEPVAD